MYTTCFLKYLKALVGHISSESPSCKRAFIACAFWLARNNAIEIV